jgi:hypothetical protein
MFNVRHRRSRHTISYVKKVTYDVVYDKNLQCSVYNTYDIVCISGPTISCTVYIPCDIRYSMYVIRCRRSIYDVNKTYDIIPACRCRRLTFLIIARTISYVRSDRRHSRCHIQCRRCIPTISLVTYDIVCGKNADDPPY